jgi:hypothetical protein
VKPTPLHFGDELSDWWSAQLTVALDMKLATNPFAFFLNTCDRRGPGDLDDARAGPQSPPVGNQVR